MKLTSLMLCTLCLSGYAMAQERSDPPAYRVDFLLRDGSDKATQSVRRYSMMVDPSGRNSFRVGQRVPYATSSTPVSGVGGGQTPLVATQFQYADVGVNIDCTLREAGSRVILHSEIEISAQSQKDKALAALPPPSVNSLRLTSNAVLTLGKSTVVANFDDPTMMRKIDVEVTVTKMN